MPSAPIEEKLARLQAHYATRMNAAVAAGRMDLVKDLANDCHDEALDMMLAVDDTSELRTQHEVEILELGAQWPTWQGHTWPRSLRFRFWRRGG
jgi:hypothetical protein